MNADNELRLSYYQKVADIDAKHDVFLVKNIDNGRFYVQKKLVSFDHVVFEILKKERFSGVPKIIDVISCEPEDNDISELIVIEEYINGSTLDAISEEQDMSVEEISDVIMSLCRILEPLHNYAPPVIHRDIKPSNVMISDEGDVFLIDFDAGKLYSEGKNRDTVLIGTKGYAAPEQYGFGQSDARTDIYLLGSLAEELIDGRKCYLTDIIEKCKAMNPADRYQNVGELADNIACRRSQGIITEHTNTESAKTGPHDASTHNKNKLITDSYLLPGFRSHDILRTVMALLWYAFIIYYAFMPLTKSDIADNFGKHDHILAASAMFLCTLIAGDYRGMTYHLPLTRSDKLWVRLLGKVLYCIVIFVALAGISLWIS